MKAITFILICSSYLSFGQLIIDAGPSKVACSSAHYPVVVQLGDSISISGGIPPFSYSWSLYDTVFLSFNSYFIRKASYYLDDTTSSNPVLTYQSDLPIYFVLEITDSTNETATDTLFVNASHYLTAMWSTKEYSIYKGDSAFLNGNVALSGGVNPIDYIWRPSSSLIDSTSFDRFWAKPNSTSEYSLTATDSLGCTFTVGPYYRVYVNPIGIQHEMHNRDLSLYPNPTSSTLKIEFNQSLLDGSIELYSMMGQFIRSYSVDGSELELDVSDLKSGSYIIIIKERRAVVGREIVVKE